jgi:hypothetical protein
VIDPAIEAAIRSAPAHSSIVAPLGLVAAAREMAKPIREWFDLNHGRSAIEDALLDTLAPLIFSSEELQ